jgi:hypothetical protein
MEDVVFLRIKQDILYPLPLSLVLFQSEFELEEMTTQLRQTVQLMEHRDVVN